MPDIQNASTSQARQREVRSNARRKSFEEEKEKGDAAVGRAGTSFSNRLQRTEVGRHLDGDVAQRANANSLDPRFHTVIDHPRRPRALLRRRS